MEFKTNLPFNDFHEADNLIVACSDPRFRLALNKFEESLGGEVDRIIAPGGPLIFCAKSYGLTDSKQAVMSWTRLLAEHHKVKNIYLISHIGCAAYGAALQSAGKSSDLMSVCQKNDMDFVAGELSKSLPGVKIRKFVAQTQDGQIVFTEQA